MRKLSTNKRGFTLVELMIVVAIVGVLAALAIYGVRKYILNAKSAEARNGIGQIAKDATTAYSREGMAATILAAGESAGVTNRLCGSATLTPSSVPAGQKYQTSPADWKSVWDAGDPPAGWSCLGFSMNDPQYYSYNYEASATDGAEGDTFTALAQGDLDGDGEASTFSMNGEILTSDGVLTLVTAPNMTEVAPDE